MPETNCFDLETATVVTMPFPHFSANEVLTGKKIGEVYNWFQDTKIWNLVETEFYEQYEFSLLHTELPDQVKCLISEETLSYIEQKYIQEFKVKALKLVDVVGHKLVNEQRIGIHNDFINGEETHRLVLHINPHWKDENGGLLLLFNSSKPQDMAKIVKPVDNTAFGFEISRQSHHAVSKIYDYTRYTIVYTFKQA
ncbi:MAG: 2OG-Fe(II) oxygenase [Chitinophagaceae bacterium]|nr:MAG: 2OG-Fe(II) oxygenase [Chitinophagaceae bacterium]